MDNSLLKDTYMQENIYIKRGKNMDLEAILERIERLEYHQSPLVKNEPSVICCFL